MKVAIAGFGIEGRSNYQYYKNRGYEVTIADERPELQDAPEGATILNGPGVFEKLDGFDLVIRTASLAPRKIKTDGKVWSATNEFFAQCPATIIGVTGSKGKGTVCSLIASILRASGRTVHLLGNIGVPALDELEKIQPDDIVVYELSSFQLWDAEKSPHIAVVNVIEPDHLDIHADFEEYVAAKSRITKYQTATDIVVYALGNEYSRQIAEQSVGTKLPAPEQTTTHVENGAFWYGEAELCSVDALQLPGPHNRNNACLAITAVWPLTQDIAAIETGLRNFTGLPHRLKFVRTVNEVDYYDDSIATTPGSAIAAIKAFEQPKVMILGGSSKGGDFQEMAVLAVKSNVRGAVLIGQEAERIEPLLKEQGVSTQNLGTAVKMPEIVAAAQAMAQPGDVVLMSPACASFGMFKSYKDRGEQFVAAVEAL
jgi:UDP-N-acetylmuramoylalanine--D-glutamate ligase